MTNLTKTQKPELIKPEINDSIPDPVIDKIQQVSEQYQLSRGEIQQIAESVKQSFEDRKNLNLKVLQAIQRFISIRSVNDMKEIESIKKIIMRDLQNVQNETNQTLADISKKLKDSNNEWEETANKAIALFDIE